MTIVNKKMVYVVEEVGFFPEVLFTARIAYKGGIYSFYRKKLAFEKMLNNFLYTNVRVYSEEEYHKRFCTNSDECILPF